VDSNTITFKKRISRFLTSRPKIGILSACFIEQSCFSSSSVPAEKIHVSEAINVEVPNVGESISEVQVGQWLKAEGDWVESGEDLVEIETEKASVQIPAPASGLLEEIRVASEEFCSVGDVIALIRIGEKPETGDADSSKETSKDKGKKPKSGSKKETSGSKKETSGSKKAAEAEGATQGGDAAAFVMPAAQRLLNEHGLAADQVSGTGPRGRILKKDILAFIENQSTEPAPATTAPVPTATATTSRATATTSRATATTSLITDAPAHRSEEIKPLSMLRRTIAARLVAAQQTAALLTTFNEVDMQPVMAIRKKYKDRFIERHGVKLGFMSFFAKAAVEALRRYPAVNAEVRGNDIVYRHYQDIGVAIGGGKGLVVPVLRNVEEKSFAEIELAISEFAKQAMENRLQPADLIGGTFTISNGGVYGSMLSTPIVNPPQSGILGLHAIQERPVALDGNVVIRPMMFVALTYDHRIVDGREAVGFLRTIKDVIEDPARLFLEL
jgi:2-oxoglutarate dehydrogenase E2 component (dihydrolipoamide succinyltransferase)